MPFPTDERLAKKLGAAIDLVARLKSRLTLERSSIATGSYSADDLLGVLGFIKDSHKALLELSADLNLPPGSPGSLGGGLHALLQSIVTTLQWSKNNLPSHQGYLLVYSLDEDFKLIPRVFDNGPLIALDQQLNNILMEIG